MGSCRSRLARQARSIDDMTTVVEALTRFVEALTRLVGRTRRLWLTLVGLVVVIIAVLHQAI